MTNITTDTELRAAEDRLRELTSLIAKRPSPDIWPEGEFVRMVEENNALFNATQEYRNPVLHKLRVASVFEVYIGQDNKAVFVEMCDENFAATLTGDELLALAGELTNIAEQMK
ncbi:hypothetical protein [Larkinella terrae]|uniref:Uncharacterized protein n=1 Tax=Larkinella terrae TaxID=2025311 RepID=A0A7K0EJR1_9BACT|nr:hypothetical protein [Larkinella terrae]MRS61761.1 hypothetical protein [Larkinella terrae]